MDVVSFLHNEGHSEILSKVLMKPYQLTLISHLKNSHELNDKSITELPINKAIEIANSKTFSLETSYLEDRLNKELLKQVHHQEKKIGLKLE